MAISISLNSLNERSVFRIRTELTHKQKATIHNKKGKTIEAFIENNTNIIVPFVYACEKFEFNNQLRNADTQNFKINPPQFRDGQEEVFIEALNYLQQQRSVYLQLHCGWGKTWLGLNIAAKMNIRTLVIYHRTFLGDQWFNESQGIIPNQVTMITNNNVDENTEGKLFLATVDRAGMLPGSFRKTIDFLIVDEAKYFCTKTRVETMLQYRPLYTMGLCAERTRQDGMHTMLDQFWGPTIFRKSIKPFLVWKYKTRFRPNIVRPKWGAARVDWNEVIRSLAENEDRNIKIRDICRLFGEGKMLVLCKRVEHVKTLAKLLKECGEDVQTLYGSANGFKNCRILIATYQKAEIGFDDKNLCTDFDGERLSWLILAADKQDIEQSVGRVMRSENPKVIHIVDEMGTLEKHWEKCLKWYKSRNAQIMKTEFI